MAPLVMADTTRASVPEYITTGSYTPFRKSMSTIDNRFPDSGDDKKGVFSFFQVLQAIISGTGSPNSTKQAHFRPL